MSLYHGVMLALDAAGHDRDSSAQRNVEDVFNIFEQATQKGHYYKNPGIAEDAGLDLLTILSHIQVKSEENAEKDMAEEFIVSAMSMVISELLMESENHSVAVEMVIVRALYNDGSIYDEACLNRLLSNEIFARACDPYRILNDSRTFQIVADLLFNSGIPSNELRDNLLDRKYSNNTIALVSALNGRYPISRVLSAKENIGKDVFWHCSDLLNVGSFDFLTEDTEESRKMFEVLAAPGLKMSAHVEITCIENLSRIKAPFVVMQRLYEDLIKNSFLDKNVALMQKALQEAYLRDNPEMKAVMDQLPEDWTEKMLGLIR